jgi:colanic acid biosynthesis protein WcaH
MPHSEHQAGYVSDADFVHVVRFAPLVSVDLVIRDPEARVLVGRRMNEPARGTYFVPGGAIRKNETIRSAFARILHAETGLSARLEDARFLGVHEHFYDTNRFGVEGFGTHYVVLAYELKLDHHPTLVRDAQHSDFKWLAVSELLAMADVHQNTKAYFE